MISKQELLKMIRFIEECEPVNDVDWIPGFLSSAAYKYTNFADKIIEVGDTSLVMDLLEWVDLTPDQLRKIYKQYSNNTEVKKLIAGNVHTPKDILLELSTDKNKQVQELAKKSLENQDKDPTTEEVLLFIIDTYFAYYGAYEFVEEGYINDFSKETLKELLEHCPNMKETLIEWLKESKNGKKILEWLGLQNENK